METMFKWIRHLVFKSHDSVQCGPELYLGIFGPPKDEEWVKCVHCGVLYRGLNRGLNRSKVHMRGKVECGEYLRAETLAYAEKGRLNLIMARLYYDSMVIKNVVKFTDRKFTGRKIA
jgi:hypothetical protein